MLRGVVLSALARMITVKDRTSDSRLVVDDVFEDFALLIINERRGVFVGQGGGDDVLTDTLFRRVVIDQAILFGIAMRHSSQVDSRVSCDEVVFDLRF